MCEQSKPGKAVSTVLIENERTCVTEWRFKKYGGTLDGIVLRKLNQVERTPITHCRHLALLRQRQCTAYH